MFAMGALQIGATVPVMVDPTDPNRLTIDVAGEGAASAARQARPVTDLDATGVPRQVQPNTLSTMGTVAPNTISTAGTGPIAFDQGQPPYPMPPAMSDLDATTVAAITQQLSRVGITVDPGLIAGGQTSIDAGGAGTLDLRPDAVASVLANGIPSTAFIRSLTDTGVNVRGDSLVRLSLDVRGPGGETYPVETGSLVPDSARSRALQGATVPVRIDRTQPMNVAVDWSALD